MKNNLFAALIVGLFLIFATGLMVACDNNGTTPEPDAYYKANDGEYLPVYRIQATATRINNTVEVEYNGNLYSAWVSPDSEIQTGDTVTCVFAMYEGNFEFVDIIKN